MIAVAGYTTAIADCSSSTADNGREARAGGGRGGGLAGFAGEDGLAERAKGIRARVEGVRHQFAGFGLECQLGIYVTVEFHP